MSIHKLHIFAKNRDAVAAQKGYSYQQLKTLEDWLENRIAGGDEDIYCDFEDDIFARNITEAKATFKQIKLYSSDFSFSSVSIKKAISHFFSLYTKGEYSFDQVKFHFETNVSVVGRNIKDNDAELLEEWHSNQKSISTSLLNRIRVRVKKILEEYIDERTEELIKNVELKSELQIAKNIYDKLTDEDFDKFILAINWQFDGEETNSAIESILARIQHLIPKIPLPLDGDKTTVYSSLLVNEVFQRSIHDEPEDRKLTKELIDVVLLNAGESEDKWYAEKIQQRKGLALQYFYPGEFQTVISGVRYCRSRQLDDSHALLWLALLKEYINLPETPLIYKRKAIYEYCFLKISHGSLYPNDAYSLADDSEFVNYYFTNWQRSTRILSMEDDIILLQLIKSQQNRLGLSEEQIYAWEKDIKTYLEAEAVKEKNVDRLCELFEMQGHLAHQSAIFDPSISYQTTFDYYKKIPPLLEQAYYYSLYRLYAQMQQMVKMLTKHGKDDELLELTDQFMSEIQEYADKTGLRHKAAQDLVERGVLHIEHHDLPNYLKALELFQKAKDKWRLEYSKEGYLLSLLGIASVYEELGMTYASKYYSLIALWSTWHSANPTLYKHLPKAFSQIMHLDYTHGAWINAINDFSLYLIAKREFDEKGLELKNDESYYRAIFEGASIVHAVSLLHPPMNEFINGLLPKLGYVWSEQIYPFAEKLAEQLADVEALKRKLHHNLIDHPLNDVGPIRTIRFSALHIEWAIEFANDNELTAIGEEFVSFLQITLCEVARVNSMILSKDRKISIVITKGHFQRELIAPDSWVITVPNFDSKEQPAIQRHYVYISTLIKAILQEVSTASKEEFTQFYMNELHAKGKLGEKALEAAAYQRVFRNTVRLPDELNEQKKGLPVLEDESSFISSANWLV